ncbi:hypothetical protein QQ045_003417 [Rhodiola kirilowii]
MRSFLEEFFSDIWMKLKEEDTTTSDMYCMYNSQVLTAVTSSLYIGGLISCLFAPCLTSAIDHRSVIIVCGCTSFVGCAINGGATNIITLTLGRILVGVGVGFTTLTVPVYLSKIAPPKWRGAFNTGFQIFLRIGVLLASFINLCVSPYPFGWKISVLSAIVPTIFMTVGALFISDSPSSLVERGKLARAKKVLSNTYAYAIYMKHNNSPK